MTAALLTRTVYTVIPHKVDYELTDLGRPLGTVFCGAWYRGEQYRGEIEATCQAFTERTGGVLLEEASSLPRR
ncbi:winged helix-turn-helix transcriptional regulator [Deinococcus alpinitundrae]|uniref:winged helix-turn-helix transcriptional regulator n=1 Tax=Deinococcus alpinitundrae TaxID=468913 RepID=UPI001ED8CE96|nr:winged helix-turn-helix transcriptional regulator [Deinococcus alpinitundrae]